MNARSFSTGITRRKAIQYGAAGAAGALLAARSIADAPPPKAKSVIQIWMWGGPCHIDTFDPKPDAGSDFSGPLDHPIATNIDGVQIGELLPLLAKQAHRYSIVRSMTHGVNAHETAAYMVQTGRQSAEGLVFPGVGAVVALFKGYKAGYKGTLPPYIVLTELQGRFSESGFLDARCKPFATGGDPADRRFAVEGLSPQGISEERQQSRRELLQNLNVLKTSLSNDPRLAAWAKCEQDAEDVLASSGKVFDLAQEKDALRDRYGRSTFGQSCLAARRLVEHGVPYITINYKGWDTHQQHFQAMRRMLPELDRGMSALLEDLSERGLLDSTVVWWGGEFGRTPRVQWEAPWNGGRNHHGKAFCSVLAGGGFKGGRVLGATDRKGEEVIERPVYPADLIASIYQQLGIDPHAELPHPQGIKLRVTPSEEEASRPLAMLKELV